MCIVVAGFPGINKQGHSWKLQKLLDARTESKQEHLRPAPLRISAVWSLPKAAPLPLADERKVFSRCYTTSMATSGWAVSFRTKQPCKQVKNQQTAFLPCSDLPSSLCTPTRGPSWQIFSQANERQSMLPETSHCHQGRFVGISVDTLNPVKPQ